MNVTKTIQNLYLDVLVTGVLFATIAGLTLLSVPHLPAASGHDKLYHGIAFAALTFPICSFRPSGSIIILSLAALFGAMIEIIQPLVGPTGRYYGFLGRCGWHMSRLEPGTNLPTLMYLGT